MDKRTVKDDAFRDGDGRSGDGRVLVRFELPATVSATTASVCGDFNGWQAEAHPLTRLGDGRFSTDLVLSAGERYRFRYLLDGQRWENDPAADDYVPNGLGSEDSVVDLTDTRSLPAVDATALAASGSPAGPSAQTPSEQATPGGVDGPTDVEGLVRSQPQPGLQRVRLRLETWERIEAEAAARGMEPHDFVGYLLEVAMSPHVWRAIEHLTQREQSPD